MKDIPATGFGTWKIPREKAAETVFQAILSGVRHLDCASDYGNEIEVGLGIKQAIDKGIVRREELWITSKLWNTYHLQDHVELACKKTLDDLQLDYLDLYMIHFPISLKFVPFEVRYPPEWMHDMQADAPRIELETKAPMHLTWRAMEELVSKKLAVNIGVCNFSYQLLADLLSYAVITPYALQIELHPYLTQTQLVDFCMTNGLKVVAFSPLGSPSYVELGMDGGLGAGPLKEPVVAEIAERLGKSSAQIVLRWGIQRGCSVIPKSNRSERIVENMDVLNFELTSEEVICCYSRLFTC